MALSRNKISDYNQTRNQKVDKSVLCHAPWQSINFTQNGDATVCCYNKAYVLGSYPNNAIGEMWFGKLAQALRTEMRKNPLPAGCQNCALQIESENYAAVHAKHYDFHSDHPIKHVLKQGKNLLKLGKFTAYPRVMEFELSNTCNLECIMCNGYFSSSIRKNREKAPPMKLVFDDGFVEQLVEFIPHLTDAKFLGGEPFLIPIYQKIWDKIIQINPRCKLHITTNASTVSEKNWEVINQLRSNIIVSIDSLKKDPFEQIRKGADFDVVMENIEKLRAYTANKKTDMNFSVCPMTLNWEEMPEIIQYGIDHEIYIYFNTVFYPEELSLKNIHLDAAKKIITHYETVQFQGKGFYYEYNKRQMEGLMNMLKYWHKIS